MTKEWQSNKLASKYIDVCGSKMHYIEAGQGRPILFLHGVPTSSYVWRHIIPHLALLGRCIAPDLIGFGSSAKPNIDYSITDHIRYIEKFIDALKLDNLVIIMHGLGSVIGFDYAMKHEKRCAGLVFYESLLRSENGYDVSLPLQEQLNNFAQQESELDLATDGTSFVDKMILQSIMRRLTEEEMQNYRQPFSTKASCKPITQYLKEMPKGLNNSKVDKIIADYSVKLTKSTLPKLMLYSVPGFITTIATVMWAKEHIPNLELVDIGDELHLGQEVYSERIGETISAWLQAI